MGHLLPAAIEAPVLVLSDGGDAAEQLIAPDREGDDAEPSSASGGRCLRSRLDAAGMTHDLRAPFVERSMSSDDDWRIDGGGSVQAGGSDSCEGFEIDVQHPATDVVLLSVRGEVDLWNSVALMEAIIGAFAEHPELIAVDLSDVAFMDAAGLRVLAEGAHHMEEARVRFAVVCPTSSQVAGLLGSANAHRLLNVHESTEDALGPWLDEAGELPAGV